MAEPAGAPSDFADEQLSVIVVVREHQSVDDTLWLQRYRMLFTSLNRYAKPTHADTNIIMDEDDLFAIVTRRLITDHEFFRSPHPEQRSFRVLTKGKNVRSGASHFTSLQTFCAMNQTLLMSTERRVKWGEARDLKVFLQFRPEESEIDRCYRTTSNLWDALLRAVPELREAPERMRTHNLPDPNPDGYQDQLLFWPIVQELVVRVARSLFDGVQMEDDAEIPAIESELRPLAGVPWGLHGSPWRYLLLVPGTPEKEAWRVRSEDRKSAVEIGERLVRWLVGLDPLDDEETAELRSDWYRLLYPEPPQKDQVETMWQETVSARARIVTQ